MGERDRQYKNLCVKNVSTVLPALLHRRNLFIYLIPRKTGFNNNPFGMALPHGGLGPVSRIRSEWRGRMGMEALLLYPGATQCPPNALDMHGWQIKLDVLAGTKRLESQPEIQNDTLPA